jgi:hypothetical protein
MHECRLQTVKTDAAAGNIGEDGHSTLDLEANAADVYTAKKRLNVSNMRRRQL